MLIEVRNPARDLPLRVASETCQRRAAAVLDIQCAVPELSAVHVRASDQKMYGIQAALKKVMLKVQGACLMLSPSKSICS